jgi:hypothetical protein
MSEHEAKDGDQKPEGNPAPSPVPAPRPIPYEPTVSGPFQKSEVPPLPRLPNIEKREE